MKLTRCISAHEYSDLASQVAEMWAEGYRGVELAYPVNATAQIKEAVNAARLEVSCVSANLRFTNSASLDETAADSLRDCMDATAALGCSLVKIPGPQPLRRQSILTTISAMANWLAPLAKFAGERGVRILIENGTVLASARSLWLLIERVDQAALGIYWNVEHSLAAGERVAVTVPTLGRRIRFVQMGERGNSEAIERLRGIGFQGWIDPGKRMEPAKIVPIPANSESSGDHK